MTVFISWSDDGVSHYKGIALNGRMVSELWNGKYLEGSGRGLILGDMAAFLWMDWEKTRENPQWL